jgi:hypothetical protein
MPSKNSIKIGEFLKSSVAITEVLDFVTILGILILSFSLIGLVGYPALKNTQEIRYIENTRQSFIVMAENINKIALGESPSQSVEMKMYGGTLRVKGSGTITIIANMTNQTTNTVERTTLYSGPMGGIENSIGDAIVAYEGTGVWMNYPSGETLVASKPLIANHSSALIIPVVFMNGLSSTGGTGMSRIMVCPDNPCSPRVSIFNNVSNITVSVSSEYASGWEDYFENALKWDVETGPDTVNGSLNTAKNLDLYLLGSQLYTVIK